MSARTTLLLFTFLSVCLPSAHAQTTRYVDDDAPTGGDGLAWTTAYKYLQDALWEAAINGAIAEIRVAQGTYKPDQDEGHVSPGDRTATFGLISGVALMGGYAGIGAPDPDARDIEAYETILSGDLAGDDGPNFANNGDNSYHVVSAGVIDATAVLDGVTITGGNGTQGGGVYLVGVDENSPSDPTLVNCTVRANRATTGGGIYFLDSGAVLTDCALSGNSAAYGGGFAVKRGSSSHTPAPTFLRCTVSGNSASSQGGGGWVKDTWRLRMHECTLSDNTADVDGGALALVWNFADAYLSNCVLRNNHANRDGGAVYNASDIGGGCFFRNCVFTGNFAGGLGGAHRGDSFGAAQSFRGCTFYGNGAYNGGAISIKGDQAILVILNCILWGDAPDELMVQQGPYVYFSINYTDVQGGAAGGTGNIGLAPLFVDRDGPDGIVGTEDDNLRLRSPSPCINAGDPALVNHSSQTDLDGHARVLCGRVDMGAYEFGVGDFDCDRGVDLDDFASWPGCMTGPDAGPYLTGCEAFDFEFDADVDVADFRRFQLVFGTDTP